MTWAKVKSVGDDVAFTSSYDPSLIASLKTTIPGNDRRPIYKNGKFSHWLIDSKHISTLSKIVKENLGVQLDGITAALSANTKQTTQQYRETKLFKVLYIGLPKDRGNGVLSSFGLVGDDWSISFPETALREFFECVPVNQKTLVNHTTRYAVLGINHDAPGIEIKKAYRQMAKRWHPDVNRDEDANEMFKKINKAYKTLSNPLQRRKYDAGLLYQASVDDYQQPQAPSKYYRPPIRCGYFLCIGIWRLGRFHVEKITQREDITNDVGQIMTSYWDKDKNEVAVSWV